MRPIVTDGGTVIYDIDTHTEYQFTHIVNRHYALVEIAYIEGGIARPRERGGSDIKYDEAVKFWIQLCLHAVAAMAVDPYLKNTEAEIWIQQLESLIDELILYVELKK
jgi:hypothetical protein